ncbi:hypothetical protein ANN_22697 [Periplaneta americana]|uniref:Uncharacterized protein n=1 Tax=Periplaneta americana TaxID=6978 RepID=A0ABQ8S8W2_PERAM|nr:hypothetical protein ANN_22697 [Periplaneta americana]
MKRSKQGVLTFVSVLKKKEMSDSEFEHESDHESDVTNDMQFKFVPLLQNFKILFNKSQVTNIKHVKEKSLLVLKSEYTRIFGKEISEKQLRKKIQNMENDLKRKTDKNVTGNKKIVLKEWEKQFMELLSAEENPVFCKVPGALIVGTLAHPVESPNQSQLPKRIKSLLPETDETKSQSTSELQRLVLLEQLKLTRVQMEKEGLIIRRLQSSSGDRNNQENEEMPTYTVL